MTTQGIKNESICDIVLCTLSFRFIVLNKSSNLLYTEVYKTCINIQCHTFLSLPSGKKLR